jgi:secernin
MYFAKNSDRPLDEAQVVEWFAARSAGGRLRTQYLELDDAGAHALLGSRPTWLWGLEHGTNEHRVAIGNEKVWTVDDPRDAPPALIGMDLVRLGLERGRTADEALDAITALLAAHGQGGSGEAGHDEPYFSSFLIVDPHGGWVLETSGRTWAARPVGRGTSISNRISLRTDWTRASADVAPGADFDAWRSAKISTEIADPRLAATRAVATSVSGTDARSIVASLRHHGERPWGAPGTADDVSLPDVYRGGLGITVCMHVPGYQGTTASMVAELRAGEAPARAWVALGSPCASVYVPVFPPSVPAPLADAATWRRFASLRDRVASDAAALPEIRSVLAPVEAELWDGADAAHASGRRGPLDAFAARSWAAVDAALARLGA